MTLRKRYGLAALACIVLIGAVLFFFLPHGLDPVSPSAAQPTGDALIARGKYLTVAADCAAFSVVVRTGCVARICATTG